tara:strand:- start:3054 stop:3668 length:615 start_codon:yes stop_codon:yes gene_type:complete
MKFQKLDLQSMQNNDEDSLSNVQNLSPKDEIRQEENNLREEAISDLKFQLHDNFSHILTDTNLSNESKSNLNNQDEVNLPDDNHDITIDEGPEFLNEAKINLKQIENLAGLSANNDVQNALLEEPTKDNLSFFISELRSLTEKRSQIKDKLHKVDNELIKLQEKIYKNKKLYENKIAELESINEIYSQSANIVSKIISEDTKYE